MIPMKKKMTAPLSVVKTNNDNVQVDNHPRVRPNNNVIFDDIVVGTDELKT